ncbi:MAG: hypothetical protein EA397_19795 [Deltaproteobacteria bacterium]|nr:MAG: hypothetical protein EA397_19795 [Deltaproteobacteria bacterium]
MLVGLFGCEGGADTDGPGGTDEASDSGSDSGTEVPSDLEWGGEAIPEPLSDFWGTSYVAAEDAIWVIGGQMLQEFDGTEWTNISDPEAFGFVNPSAGEPPEDYHLAFYPVSVTGVSATEIYLGSANGLLAMYDGSGFTKLADGFGHPEVNDHQLSLAPHPSWVSPTGHFYHLTQHTTDYQLVVWDGTARTTADLDLRIGGQQFTTRTIWGIDDDNIWVGGSVIDIFESPIHRFNGTSWNRGTLSFGDNGTITGFWGTAASDLWMTVTGNQYGSRLYHRTSEGWGGSGLPSLPSQESSYVFNHIWGTSNSNLFIASNHGLFRFDGEEWHHIDIGVDDPVLRIHGLSATKLVVEVGHSTDMAFRLVEGL